MEVDTGDCNKTAHALNMKPSSLFSCLNQLLFMKNEGSLHYSVVGRVSVTSRDTSTLFTRFMRVIPMLGFIAFAQHFHHSLGSGKSTVFCASYYRELFCFRYLRCLHTKQVRMSPAHKLKRKLKRKLNIPKMYVQVANTGFLHWKSYSVEIYLLLANNINCILFINFSSLSINSIQ